MGSYSGTSEIVEAREDLDSAQHSSKGAYPYRCHSGLSLDSMDRRKPPALKLGDKDSLEDEINQLFEAISLKNASKGLGVSTQPSTSSSSPLNRNAMMKRPMVSSVSNSPRVSSSEGVSLKQALRDLCLSKASEMAAMKRVSKSATPAASPGGASEAGRIKNLYNSVLVESKKAGEVTRDVGKGTTMVEISLVPEESSGKKKMLHLEIPKMRSLNPSAQSSPRLQALKSPANLSAQCSPRFIAPPMKPVQNEIQMESKKGGSQTTFSSPRMADQKKVQMASATRKVGSQALKSPSESTHSSPRLPPSITKGSNKNNSSSNGTITSGPKRLGAQAMKTEKVQMEKKVMTLADSISCPDSPDNSPKVAAVNPPASTKSTVKVSPPKTGRKGSTKSTKHVKTVIRSKSSTIKKKKKQGANSASSVSNEGDGNLLPVQTPMVCQKCQCALSSNANEEPVQQNPAPISAEITSYNKQNPVEKMKSSKREKGEFSQSSKSSLGDYSTSTSNSEESNASRFSSCCNRPHMSKDVRWQAVRHVKTRDRVLTLAHFNLLKKLGCGDIGTVYLAELIGTNCLFAIKVMDNEFLARRKKLPRAQTEREILRMLDHPFLPTLYAQFTSDNLSCLVMEFCPGGDLHVLRQKQLGRCFPEPAARFYVAEVLLALEYLHMLGVVYRDLKPENILVREDGHIMLTDFDLSLRCNVSPTLLQSSSSSTALTDPPRISGPCTSSSCIDPFCIEPSCRVVSCFSPRLLPPRNAAKAKVRAELLLRSTLPQLVAEPTDARSNSFVGTHEYLAPEIIKGDGHGAAVDWWTFGVFLYELLYGRTPFKGAGNEETLANVVLQGLRFPDSPLVSFHARDLIRRLLVKEPEGRLGTEKGAAEIKQHPFFEGLNWALIRCAVPPELPDNWYDHHSSGGGGGYEGGDGDQYLECKATGEHLEFELF
ncbi:unnamed protein product [Linum trigynum]|uniref:non-specific serine/threonine protein kinase n=1 Tax=Linum trigynum TaxID=586398 RepID=A0AAV2DGT3_9ROSI